MEQVAVHGFDAVRRGRRGKLIERAAPRCVPVLAHELRVPGEHDDRACKCIHVFGGHDDAGLAVGDDLGQAADVADDRGTAPLCCFEGHHPEALTA